MNNIKVLVEGYARVNPDSTWDATSTTTLINTGKLKIIVDPGCHRQKLLTSLAKAGLKTSQINYVFLTHYHPDHCSLAGIFENATVFNSLQWQKGSLGGDLTENTLPQTDIKIIKTPNSPKVAILKPLFSFPAVVLPVMELLPVTAVTVVVLVVLVPALMQPESS